MRADAGNEARISRRFLLSSAGLEFFESSDLTKNVKSSNMLGARQRCARLDERDRISYIHAPQKSVLPCSTYLSFVSCSNTCDLQVVSIFLVRGLFGVSETS